MSIEFCFYCGAEIGDSEWASQKHIDHYMPKSKGGSNDRDNLVPACRSCNLSKRAMEPGTWKTKCFNDAYMGVYRLRWLIGRDAVKRIESLIIGHENRVPLLGGLGVGVNE